MLKKSTVETINMAASILILVAVVAGVWILHSEAAEIRASLRDISEKSLVLQKAASTDANMTPASSVYVGSDEDNTVIVLEDDGDEDCIDLGCEKGTNYAGSINSNKYHRCSCMWAEQIAKENLACFKSPDDAEEKGYVPCNVCKP